LGDIQVNQDQVREKLLALEKNVDEFSVIFSGKKSTRVNGLYHPETREIIIHNHNFTDDNALMYTAIHEFAHHIQFTRSPVPITSRAHTTQFYDILHRLLFDAERAEIYVNMFRQDPRFVELTATIREQYLSANGQLMKEFGRLLLEAASLCEETGANFEDYLNRELGLKRVAAKTIMRIHSMDLNPAIGYENLKAGAAMKDMDDAREAERFFLEGQSPEMVAAEFTRRKNPSGEMQNLMAERDRIERTLDRLTARLAEIERRIGSLKLSPE
jgi:hypothetical protein